MNLDEIWQTAVDALHSGEGISRKQLDGYVRAATKGQIESFAELAQTRARHQNVAAAQEQSAINTPGAAGTFATSFGNASSFGLVNRLQKSGVGPAGLPASPDTGTEDYLNAGAEAHPIADFLGSMAGGIAPAGLLAEASPVAALLSRIPGVSKLPWLVREGIKGAGTGAAVNAGVGYTQGDLAHPDPVALAKDAAMGAAVGGPLGIMGSWGALKTNPAEHYAGRAIQESTPNETPSFHEGEAAIRAGETTPAGATSGGVGAVTPISDAAAAKMPEVLRPMNLEKSPALRTLASKRLTESAEAAAQTEQAISKRIAAVEDAKATVTDDLKTGYDAILQGHVIQNPKVAAIFARRSVDKVLTARNVFNLEQQLGKQSRHIWKVREAGTSAVNIAAHEGIEADADVLRSALGDEVPGFNDLQAQVAPYIQRGAQLRTTLKQIIGRAIKPRGKTAETPTGGVEEGLKESAGYGTSQIGEKAARQLVHPLVSTNTEDLIDFVKKPGVIPKFVEAQKALPQIGVGALSGGAQSRSKYGRKLRGLFSWPVAAEAQ